MGHTVMLMLARILLCVHSVQSSGKLYSSAINTQQGRKPSSGRQQASLTLCSEGDTGFSATYTFFVI